MGDDVTPGISDTYDWRILHLTFHYVHEKEAGQLSI